MVVRAGIPVAKMMQGEKDGCYMELHGWARAISAVLHPPAVSDPNRPLGLPVPRPRQDQAITLAGFLFDSEHMVPRHERVYENIALRALVRLGLCWL